MDEDISNIVLKELAQLRSRGELPEQIKFTYFSNKNVMKTSLSETKLYPVTDCMEVIELTQRVADLYPHEIGISYHSE